MSSWPWLSPVRRFMAGYPKLTGLKQKSSSLLFGHKKFWYVYKLDEISVKSLILMLKKSCIFSPGLLWGRSWLDLAKCPAEGWLRWLDLAQPAATKVTLFFKNESADIKWSCFLCVFENGVSRKNMLVRIMMIICWNGGCPYFQTNPCLYIHSERQEDQEVGKKIYRYKNIYKKKCPK